MMRPPAVRLEENLLSGSAQGPDPPQSQASVIKVGGLNVLDQRLNPPKADQREGGSSGAPELGPGLFTGRLFLTLCEIQQELMT